MAAYEFSILEQIEQSKNGIRLLQRKVSRLITSS